NAGIAVGGLVLGTLAAKQFEDYRRGPGGHAGHIGWTGPRHPTFDLGAFRFTVPDGWRDLSEAADRLLAHQLGHDGHMLVRENDVDTDNSVSVVWGYGRSITCTQLAAALDAQSGKGEHIDLASVHDERY